MVFTRKEKNQPKRQLSQLNETLNESITGSSTNVNAVEQETLELRTNGPHNDFERFNNSSSQEQVLENFIHNKIRRAIDDAVLTVKNHLYDVISTSMDKWQYQELRRPWDQSPARQDMGPLVMSKALIERIPKEGWYYSALFGL